MGRLLDALRTGARVSSPANPANSRIAPAPSLEDSRIREIRSGDSAVGDETATTRVGLLALAADELLPADLVNRLPDADVRGCAGLVSDSLRAYLRAREFGEAMDDGRAPPGYTLAAECAGCGPVWLWPTAPVRVLACPWCFRRKAGIAIPRPSGHCED